MSLQDLLGNVDIANLPLLVAFVVGLTQSVKQTGLLQTKYLPIVSLVVGASSHAFLSGSVGASVLISGAVVGLSTSGVVDITKSTVEKKAKKK